MTAASPTESTAGEACALPVLGSSFPEVALGPAPDPILRLTGGAFEEAGMTEAFTELYRRAATSMPPDVLDAIAAARDREEEGSVARETLTALLENSRLAATTSRPICQDTGMPLFEIELPPGVAISIGAVERAAVQATRAATAKGYLRPNSVDTLTGKNPGDGAGRGMPIVHVHESDHGTDRLHAALILKGGGCENVGAQYTLPNVDLRADRDLDGVKRVVLDAIFKAQGKGCSPGILGVCFGGDRTSGFGEAKRQLFRKLSDVNRVPELAAMEKELLAMGNLLGIGPMGFGGQTTLLGVKVGYLARLPASYFVSVSYMCWATRRATVAISPSGEARFEQ